MRFTKALLIITLGLQLFSCGNRHPRYSIEIRRYSGAFGISTYYTATDSSIIVDIDCELVNCKRKTLYRRMLTTVQSDSLTTNIKKLRLDTLKASYLPSHVVSDGLELFIRVRGSELPNTDVYINNTHLPVIDSLNKIMDGLILTKIRYFDNE